jgi:hypothetical protein
MKVDELNQLPAIASFLGNSADYGDLYEVPHTTKEKNRKQRKKWYLIPILSPYYQIPESHVKEPYYVTNPQVARWLQAAGICLEGLHYEKVLLRLPRVVTPQSEQTSLFDNS